MVAFYLCLCWGVQDITNKIPERTAHCRTCVVSSTHSRIYTRTYTKDTCTHTQIIHLAQNSPLYPPPPHPHIRTHTRDIFTLFEIKCSWSISSTSCKGVTHGWRAGVDLGRRAQWDRSVFLWPTLLEELTLVPLTTSWILVMSTN